MKSLELDGEGKLTIVNNDLNFVTESSVEVLQDLRSRLNLFKGEYFLNTDLGVDYFGTMFQRPANLSAIEDELKLIILNHEEVAELVSFEITVDAASRELSALFEVRTVYGEELSDQIALVN